MYLDEQPEPVITSKNAQLGPMNNKSKMHYEHSDNHHAQMLRAKARMQEAEAAGRLGDGERAAYHHHLEQRDRHQAAGDAARRGPAF